MSGLTPSSFLDPSLLLFPSSSDIVVVSPPPSPTAGPLDPYRFSHSLATKAMITTATGDQFDLELIDGQVTLDRTSAQRGSGSITTDPRLYPALPTDPVNATGATISLWRGIRFGDHSRHLEPLGVYRVDTLSRDTPSGGLSIELSDQTSQLADERFTSPRRLGEMTGVALIQQLITEVYPDAEFRVSTTDTTLIPKHHVRQDRLEEITRVAGVIGCEVFPDQLGVWVIQDIPDPSSIDSAWDIDAGPEGVLVELTESVTRTDAPNIIIVTSESSGGTTYKSQFPHGYDTDPASPTNTSSSYGAVPKFYTSPLITSQAQANKVADRLLADHKGLIRSVAFNAVPNPSLTVGDVITLWKPDGGHERHMIDVLTIPFTPDGAMTGETRIVDWGGQ